jgi:hypothetical protein
MTSSQRSLALIFFQCGDRITAIAMDIAAEKKEKIPYIINQFSMPEI